MGCQSGLVDRKLHIGDSDNQEGSPVEPVEF